MPSGMTLREALGSFRCFSMRLYSTDPAHKSSSRTADLNTRQLKAHMTDTYQSFVKLHSRISHGPETHCRKPELLPVHKGASLGFTEWCEKIVPFLSSVTNRSQRLACWHAACPGVIVLDDWQSEQNGCYSAPQILWDACNTHL